MADIVLIPFLLGEIGRPKPNFVYMHGQGQKVTVPISCFYISDGKHNILVDTGPVPLKHAPDFVRPYEQADNQIIINMLAQHRIKPHQIDIIILTHLHWDHCGDVSLFNNAQIFVQEEELRYAAEPLPSHEKGYFYYKEIKDSAFNSERVTKLRGDAEITKHVKTIYSPGHTPGSQCVLIENKNRTVLLTGDTVPTFENIVSGVHKTELVPSGIYVDMEQYYKSLSKISETVDRANYILPSHERGIYRDHSYEKL